MATYRRISNDNSAQKSSPPSPSSSSSIRSQNTTKTRSERISEKIHAAIWVGAALAVGKYTNFIETILTDPQILRPVLDVAFICIGINTILTIYLAFYLPWVKNIHSSDAWEVYCPRVIPTMTGVGLLAGILLIRACWPIWGFLSPLILGVEAMGALFFLHFIPWC